MSSAHLIGEWCLVLIRNGAVHYGVVHSVAERSVVILDSRRILRWEGVEDLNALAVGRTVKNLKLSLSVPRKTLFDVTEIVPVSLSAEASFDFVGSERDRDETED